MIKKKKEIPTNQEVLFTNPNADKKSARITAKQFKQISAGKLNTEKGFEEVYFQFPFSTL